MIRKYPDKALRKRAAEVSELTPEIKKLGSEMIFIMQKSQGVGLAGPQIGVAKRIIVVETEKGPEVFLNPKIIKKSKESLAEEEGCLSLPGIFLKVRRAKEVRVEVLTVKGEKQRFLAKGLTARIFQHEIDHLNGLLIINKVPFWQKIKLWFWHKNL